MEPSTTTDLISKLRRIYGRTGPPESTELQEEILAAVQVLDSEAEEIRPRDREDRPGGLLYLDPEIPTVVVPDLHARMELVLAVLSSKDEQGVAAVDRLAAGRLQLLCLGDGFHAEGRAAVRWQAALEEFKGGYRKHIHMDEEMRESLGVMEMVMALKRQFPNHFHFLKGNHENIANEQGGGNYPFLKFANEGLMVRIYMEHFYGEEILNSYAEFEKSFPILAVGGNFLASHAEPAWFIPKHELIEYRRLPQVVYGLTWTDNGEAEPGSVQQMLEHYLGPEAAMAAYHFGGHRPVHGSYNLRSDERYVQIHDPDRYVVAVLPAGGQIDLDRDIRELDREAFRELIDE
ncbi:MAG: metallophosphoesterase [Spirochaetaceae bacterium]|nr:MAG: metallophosphoesterase [Spirochaetaceae bacterium]